MILYGYGEYAKNNIPEEYYDDIEIIIDNGIPDENVDGKPVIRWDEFEKKINEFKNHKIVIGSINYKEEIKKQLMESKYFNVYDIVELDLYLVKRGMEKAGTIKKELLKDAKVLSNREAALELIPKGGVAAEVGVAYGDFSRKIIDSINPEKFYAIDMFVVDSFWGGESFKESHYSFYAEKFYKEIESGIVEMKRGFSWDELKKLPSDSIDYLYLDAGHDYWSVKKDIMEVERVVKHNGIIQFNDYTFHDYFYNVYYGVIPNVNEYVNKTNSEVLYYCLSEHGFDDIVIKNKKCK